MLDSTDEQLIELLRRDARQSSKELARQVNVSSATVRRRLSRLIQGGIMYTTAIVNHEKIGCPLLAVITFAVPPEMAVSVFRSLCNRPQIRWVGTTIGRFNVFAIAQFRSAEELSAFQEMERAKVKGLMSCEAFICVHVNHAEWKRLAVARSSAGEDRSAARPGVRVGQSQSRSKG